MQLTAEKHPGQFLLRLRKQDTPTGISDSSLEQLMDLTGLSKTEVTHLALRQMADRYLPKYEQDDGPLTTDQLRAIRNASSATDIPEDRFTERLF
jgi:transcriptional regulator with XRE-family HTH domain